MKKMKGILLCFGLALPAWWLGQQFPLVGAPVLALGLGMLVGVFGRVSVDYQQGISFSSKVLLQLAVVLLGFGLNLGQVVSVGMRSLPVIVVTVLSALLLAFVLQRILRLDSDMATLVGVGTSICGGSAIAATAPVINAKEEEVAKAVSVIFLFNVAAAVLFPHLGNILGMSDTGFALFAGTAVNDTSSVTATASVWDAIHNGHALDEATVIKLTRTLAILPITLGLSIFRNWKRSDSRGGFSFKKVFPIFLLYFVLASLVTTTASSWGVEMSLFSPLKTLSKYCIVMAMVAIGLQTNPVHLIKTGRQALLLGAFCWLTVILVSLGMQFLLGIW